MWLDTVALLVLLRVLVVLYVSIAVGNQSNDLDSWTRIPEGVAEIVEKERAESLCCHQME